MPGLNPILLAAAFDHHWDVKRAFVLTPNADPAAAGGAPPGADPAAAAGGAPPGADPSMTAGAPPADPNMAAAPPADPAAAGGAPPAEPAPAEQAQPAPSPSLDAEGVRNIIREEMALAGQGGAAGAGAGGGGAKKPKASDGDLRQDQIVKMLTNLHKNMGIPLPPDILDGPSEQGGGAGGDGGSSGGSSSGSSSGGSSKKADTLEATFAEKLEAGITLAALLQNQ